jgi:hypothetical protein
VNWCQQTPSKSIPDMLLKRIHALELELSQIEIDIGKIQKECPERTSCYLRWGPGPQDYAAGGPTKGALKIQNGGTLEYCDGLEKWHMVLADFYAEQATLLVRKREALLAKKYRLTSRWYRITTDSVRSMLNVPRFRAP